MLILGLASATVLFVWGTLFARVRRLAPGFLGCALCLGFWVGLAGSLLHDRYPAVVDHAMVATTTSALALTLYLVLRRLDGS